MNQTQNYFFLDQCSSCYTVWNSETKPKSCSQRWGRPYSNAHDSEVMQVQIGLDVQT